MHETKEKKSVWRALSEVLCIVFGVGVFFGAFYWCSLDNENTLLISILSSFVFIAGTIFIKIGFRSIEKKRKINRPSGPVLGSIMYDTVNNSNEPALICDENKKIIWFNKYAQIASGQTSSLLGTKLSNILPTPLPEDGDKKRELLAELNSSTYSVAVTKIRSNDKIYHLLMFRDITELMNLKEFVREEETIVSYIIVDNLEELLQFEQEKYREAAAKIETEIRLWAESVGGIVKEYEKDKYIFVFKTKDLDKFIENKFEILDKIRDIRVGSGNVPVTVSIGVSKVRGELIDKEKAAHIALDMALQRGGDQAVLKNDDSIEFFGGRTNAVHRRTKVRARVAANKLAGYMAAASNVIIMGHKYPDYDAFGASVGLARLAMFCGVKVNIVTDFKNPNIKKCMKSFNGNDMYNGIFVDKSRALDLVRSETLLVIADVNNPDMFESIDIYDNVYNTVIVDHHRKTTELDKKLLIEYIDPSSSSASELVSEMLEQSLPPSTLKKVEANMLLAGISLDTKQFTKGTGTKTYAAAMYLRDNGASYEDIQDLFKTNIVDYRQVSRFGQKVEIYRHGMVIAVNYEVGESTDRTLAAKVADNLLMIEDVSASFALMQIEDTIHISARSSGSVNVQLILEKLKGGGRYDAAGAQMKSATMQQALLKLKNAIDGYFDAED